MTESALSPNNSIATFDNVSKRYPLKGGGNKVVIEPQTFTIPRKNIGIMGVNGAGKSTLVRLIAGADLPSTGKIHRHVNISWPLALSAGFNGSMTGIENLRFVCRIYNRDIKEVEDFVADFSELGKSLNQPVKTYSSGMRAKLNFGLSLAFNFDCYLVDEVLAVGDKTFQHKSKRAFKERLTNSNILLVSHVPGKIKQFCDSAFVLTEGKLHYFDNVEDATKSYNEYMRELRLRRQGKLS